MYFVLQSSFDKKNKVINKMSIVSVSNTIYSMYIGNVVVLVEASRANKISPTAVVQNYLLLLY